MKLYLNKKGSVDYSNPIKPPKTDRPTSRPYFVATEANEASYYLDPNSIFPGKALPGHLAPKKRTKSRPSVILNQSQNKSLAKISYYMKTEDSVVNQQDVSCDDIMAKFGKMKLELKQSKEKEKLYLTKINNLEKEKEILIARLGKYKQKYVQASQENSIDKRRLSFPIESLKVAGGDELNKSKEIREIKNILILDKSVSKSMNLNEVLNKNKFSEVLNTLNSRVLEIENYANSLSEENTKVKKERDHYKRINEELKSSLEQSKLQTRTQEDFQVELIDQYKQANVDCQHLRSYLKEFVSFRTNRTNEHGTGRRTKQQSFLTSVKKSNPQPIPSYIKALSLSLCTELE